MNEAIRITPLGGNDFWDGFSVILHNEKEYERLQECIPFLETAFKECNIDFDEIWRIRAYCHSGKSEPVNLELETRFDFRTWFLEFLGSFEKQQGSHLIFFSLYFKKAKLSPFPAYFLVEQADWSERPEKKIHLVSKFFELEQETQVSFTTFELFDEKDVEFSGISVKDFRRIQDFDTDFFRTLCFNREFVASDSIDLEEDCDRLNTDFQFGMRYEPLTLEFLSDDCIVESEGFFESYEFYSSEEHEEFWKQAKSQDRLSRVLLTCNRPSSLHSNGSERSATIYLF